MDKTEEQKDKRLRKPKYFVLLFFCLILSFCQSVNPTLTRIAYLPFGPKPEINKAFSRGRDFNLL